MKICNILQIYRLIFYFISANELMLGLHVFRETGPPRRVDCLIPLSVCHMKIKPSRLVPCPRTQQASLFFTLFLYAERQARKLRIPLSFLVRLDFGTKPQVYRLQSGRSNHYATIINQNNLCFLLFVCCTFFVFVATKTAFRQVVIW